MLMIAGGLLLAVAVLAIFIVAFRYVILALSAAVSLAIAAGIWFLVAANTGRAWATAILVAGFAIWFWSANRDQLIEAAGRARLMFRQKNP